MLSCAALNSAAPLGIKEFTTYLSPRGPEKNEQISEICPIQRLAMELRDELPGPSGPQSKIIPMPIDSDFSFSSD